MLGGRRLWILHPTLVAFAAIAVAIFVPHQAEARKAMFRVQREFLAMPFGPPGPSGTLHRICAAGAVTSMQPCPFEPPTTGGTAVCGAKSCPPATLSYTSVGAGKSFTLPKAFIDVSRTRSCSGLTPLAGPCSYTGYSFGGVYDYVNAPAHFRPNNPYGASTTTRVVFPTTIGNPYPNQGSGYPVTPTTTFSGRYDFSRAGSIQVVPGPNRFGGTLRMLQGANASQFALKTFTSPFVYQYFGGPTCQVGGVACTSQQPTVIGQTTVSRRMTRFVSAGSGKSTDGSGNYLTWMAYYLNLRAPWTTGVVYGSMPYYKAPHQKHGAYTGYDHRKVKRRTGKSTLQYQVGVVSLVRPRLVHGYLGPGMSSGPTNFYRSLRVERIKVHFLPEADSLTLIGAGLAILFALGWSRRRP